MRSNSVFLKRYDEFAGVSDSAMSLDMPILGSIVENEPMARYTSWRVGGPADKLFRPQNIDDLANYLSQEPQEKIYFLGLGSNVLIRDGGIRGTVVLTSNLLKGLDLATPTQVRAEAGVACNKVAKFSAKNNLIGCEFLAGIPGTMGGALAMNAGAFGGETWDKVAAVETIDRQGNRHLRMPQEYEISYRSVSGPEQEWFVAAYLQLTPGDSEESTKRIKQLLAKRNETQPTNKPNCGSVFRNPDQDFSARLIEMAGLKGYCIGDACVSEKHANFIVNMGKAKAADIEALITRVAETVEKIHSIKLVREVHILGEPLEQMSEEQ